MSDGSYDRRAPSAASQIITLERLLEKSEDAQECREEYIAELEAYYNAVMLERDELREENQRLKDENDGLLSACESLSADNATLMSE